jgi:hypothetical protein
VRIDRTAHIRDELTLEQQVAVGFVEGEHNTFDKWEYDLWDDKMKKNYHRAMVAQLNGH